MGAVIFMPRVVHSRANSMICKPIGDGSLLCEPVVNGPVSDKFVGVLLVLLLIAALGVLAAVCWGTWQDRKLKAKYRRELEEELAKSVSERMPNA